MGDQLVFQRGKASTDIAGLHNGWQPMIPHAINCIEQDNDDHDGDKDGEGDGECGDGSDIKCHMCDPVNKVVTIDDDVIWDCSDDHCQFACIDDDVNIDLVVCVNKKWEFTGGEKKNGIFCGDKDKKKDKDKDNHNDNDDDDNDNDSDDND